MYIQIFTSLMILPGSAFIYVICLIRLATSLNIILLLALAQIMTRKLLLKEPLLPGGAKQVLIGKLVLTLQKSLQMME